MHFVSFKIGERNYALSLENVESVHRMVALTPLPEAPGWMAGLVDFHGQAVPAIDVRQRLGRKGRKPRIDDRLLIVNDDARKMALIVEEASEILEVSEDLMQAPDTLSRSRPITSVIRKEERLILVLDPARLLPAEDADAMAGILPETVSAPSRLE